MPRNDSDDSSSTTLPSSSVACTRAGSRALGSRWRQRIWSGVPPMARAASTNSRCCRLRISARISRLIPIQEVAPSTRVTVASLGPNSETTVSSRNSQGMASRASTPRISRLSTRRPPRAAAAPTATPRVKARKHRDQAHHQRHPGGVDHARQHVAPEPVGAEQEDHGIGHAVGGEIGDLLRGEPLDPSPAFDLEAVRQALDAGGQQPAAVAQVHRGESRARAATSVAPSTARWGRAARARGRTGRR